MKKLRLLLLDANVMIMLHELGLWDKTVDLCDIHLAGTVIDEEALFFRDSNGDEHSIDLLADIASAKVIRFDVGVSLINAFKTRFRSDYFDALDPGEAESLTYLVNSKERYHICSADKIVYRVLGYLYLADQGISLEEVLQRIGQSRKVDHEYSKSYREYWSSEGVPRRSAGHCLAQISGYSHCPTLTTVNSTKQRISSSRPPAISSIASRTPGEVKGDEAVWAARRTIEALTLLVIAMENQSQCTRIRTSIMPI